MSKQMTISIIDHPENIIFTIDDNLPEFRGCSNSEVRNKIAKRVTGIDPIWIEEVRKMPWGEIWGYGT
jgi:hypothetical protein